MYLEENFCFSFEKIFVVKDYLTPLHVPFTSFMLLQVVEPVFRFSAIDCCSQYRSFFGKFFGFPAASSRVKLVGVTSRALSFCLLFCLEWSLWSTLQGLIFAYNSRFFVLQKRKLSFIFFSTGLVHNDLPVFTRFRDFLYFSSMSSKRSQVPDNVPDSKAL